MELARPVACLQRPVSRGSVPVRLVTKLWTVCPSKVAVANLTMPTDASPTSFTFFVWARHTASLTKCFVYAGGCGGVAVVSRPWNAYRPIKRRLRGTLSCVLPASPPVIGTWSDNIANVRGIVASCVLNNIDVAVMTYVGNGVIVIDVCQRRNPIM